MTRGSVRDTEMTPYRGYLMSVQSDRVIVFGPRGTRAEFASMSTARKFIKLLPKADRA